MSASYTSGQSSCPRIQPAALRRKRATLSLAHRSWSLNWDTHLYPPHNNSSVHLIPQQQEYGALGGSPMECRVVGENCETPYFHSWHRYPPYWNDPAKSSMILVKPPPHRCRTFSLLLTQMAYGPFCGLRVWRRRTDRRPCCPPMSSPLTSPWNARPGDSWWRNNRLAAQHPWSSFHGSTLFMYHCRSWVTSLIVENIFMFLVLNQDWLMYGTLQQTTNTWWHSLHSKFSIKSIFLFSTIQRLMYLAWVPTTTIATCDLVQIIPCNFFFIKRNHMTLLLETLIVFAVSPLVFSWSMLGRGSVA